ncbi:MAG: hypothetical protein VKN60_00115 [Cyanobacteriota bacterium]|nr:hypothetical protein [Cyanobacteriota bacterium]
MSEYQYYEFQALDRSLTAAERAELSSISSRAKVTTRSAIFTYSYGDFREDELDLLSRHFDIFYYIANWGTQKLAFRFSNDSLAPQAPAPYCLEDILEVIPQEDEWILNWNFEQQDGFDVWIEGEGRLDELTELRGELLKEDYRPLYLAWLKGVQLLKLEDDYPEPPIPPGLEELSVAQEAFVEMFGIDRHLLSAAAQLSQPLGRVFVPSSASLRQAVAELPRSDCDDFLFKLLQGEENLGAQLRKKLRLHRPATNLPIISSRTVGQLRECARQAKEEEERRAKEAAYEKKVKSLQALAPQAPKLWDEVDTLLLESKPQNYNRAVTILRQLRDLAEYQKTLPEFQRRMTKISQRYPNRRSLLAKFKEARLLS